MVKDSISISDVINSPFGSLKKITKEHGNDFVVSVLNILLKDVADFFNLPRNFNGKQIEQTSDLIIENFPHLTIEDFKRCFKKIKSLGYGPIYDSLDGGKILVFIKQYDSDSWHEIEKHRQEEINKKREQPIEMAPQFADVLKAVLNKGKKVIEKQAPEKSIGNETMQGYIKEFDLLNDKQYNGVAQKIRLVNYKAKIYDISSYMEARFNEDYPTELKTNK